MKAKPLSPTLREKKRYIAFESTQHCSKTQIQHALHDSLHTLFGTVGAAKIGMQLVVWKSNKGVVRVTHTYTDEMKMVLAAVKKVQDQSCGLTSIVTSGVIQKAKQVVE